ncbi:MAG: response regulator [Rhodothermales bacterium]|nr:response regulator [Rhodothermales bacterium]MBO6778908.1 response regulator [Rhodothermales bacterium]
MPDAPPRVLVVDDEDDILELIRYNLESEGFVVGEARDGAEALRLAEAEPPDLIVLDVMMPRMDGLETCRRLRGHPVLKSVPIVMLTARDGEEDQVAGLDVGADIYLTKPISIPVLMSQVRATLRGSRRLEEAPDVIQVHGITIDRTRYVVEVSGQSEPLHLPRKEFELLRHFASSPGRVFSRQQLLDEVWGRDVYVVDRTVDVHVRKIREKVGEELIETIKGVGYRFRA